MILKNKQFWGTIIAVGLLAYCIKDVTLTDMKLLLEGVNYYYLIPSVVASFLFIILKALRWRVILSQRKVLSIRRAVTLFSAGQILNIMMPVLTGQVGRIFLFSKKEKIRKTFIFSTILLEVIFDALSLVVFLYLTSLAFAFPEKYREMSRILFIVTSIIVIALYVLIHHRQKIENFWEKILKKKSPSLYVGVKKFIRSFTRGMELLKSSQHLLSSMLYSIISWGLHALVVYFLLLSFGLDLPFAAAAAVMIINTLAVMIPVTPGNAGTFELAVSSSLAVFAVGRTDAVLFALALHLIDLIPIFVLGYIYLHYERVSLKEIKSSHADDSVYTRVDEEGQFVEERGSA